MIEEPSLGQSPQLVTAQEVAELIAAYEMALDRLQEREKLLNTQFELTERFLSEQLEKIHAVIDDFKEIMTEAGVARCRLSAQEALSLGNLQLESLKKLSHEMRTLMQDSCVRFERASNSTIKNIYQAVATFRIDEFIAYFDQNYVAIKEKSTAITGRMIEMFKWFQWQNIALAFSLSLISSIAIGLYVSDELPWEFHERVVKERTAGQALINAWPHLSPEDQQYLEHQLHFVK